MDKNPMFNKILDQAFRVVVSSVLLSTGAATGFADSGSIADFVSRGVAPAAAIGLEVADFVMGKV